ncbi:hypothetical protein SO802_007282 [Lithocarpus litseifolius]|uniref:Uncharacterized protein n=1 Tax=Lithocarpus litseifolius TaxID=425828 RepID=A0AAW2DRR2_9ROSI
MGDREIEARDGEFESSSSSSSDSIFEITLAKPSSSLKPSVPFKLLKSLTPSSRTRFSLRAFSSSFVTPFHALSKECFSDGKDLESIKGRFQIPSEIVSRLPRFEMATRQSKDKYARLRSMKSEPLSMLAPDAKKRKFEGPTLLALFEALVSLTLSLEAGKSVWKDPAIAVGQAHNIITNLELRSHSAIPSHELVSRRIHKLVQVLGESLQLMTDYLSIEERVVVAQSKAKSAEAESSRLRKDLVEAMDQAVKSKEKADELKKALKVEKELVAQKDDELQPAFLWTAEARDGVIA